MKKVLTFGVFDYFHYGHLKLLERAKALGDYLIVAVQKGDEIKKNKPEAKVLYTTAQRVEMISAIKYVDEVVEYSQVKDDIKNIDFDILARGGDQNHSGIMSAVEWCGANGKEVVMLSRTPDICSSQIKEEIVNK